MRYYFTPGQAIPAIYDSYQSAWKFPSGTYLYIAKKSQWYIIDIENMGWDKVHDLNEVPAQFRAHILLLT